jgi:hypothetical protein
MHDLVADGAVDITFFFGSDHTGQAVFQFIFHNKKPHFLEKGREFLPALCMYVAKN